jgi:tetratricopeptide (TPR) repeat protein
MKNLVVLWEKFRHKAFDQVVATTKPLLNTDSLNIDCNLLAGCAYTHIGKIQESVAYLEITQNHAPAISWQKSWVYQYLGNNYFLLQEYTKSRKALNACIALKSSKEIVNEAKKTLSLLGLDSYYDDWIVLETKHFIFHFQEGYTGSIHDFAQKREEAYRTLC